MTQPSSSSQARCERSPELLDCSRSRLLIVDVQEKLLPVIPGVESIAASCEYLLQAAQITAVPIVISEQYPKGLGPTVVAIRDQIPDDQIFEKLRFSAAEGYQQHCHSHDSAEEASKCDQVIIAGIETHVCVLQTTFDLMAHGLRVFVVEDATGSRSDTDRDTALRRIRDAGGIVLTAESVAFEWCEVAGTDEFKRISRLTRDRDTARRV